MKPGVGRGIAIHFFLVNVCGSNGGVAETYVVYMKEPTVWSSFSGKAEEPMCLVMMLVMWLLLTASLF